MMIDAKIIWVPPDEGGRRTIPPAGKYYAVAKFPEDIAWEAEAWSVVFELEPAIPEEMKIVSYAKVRFLVDTAPQERMKKNEGFEIYEGPKKVADVILRPPKK
jgi:hypothetical protein